jgi:hypothetical protein
LKEVIGMDVSYYMACRSNSSSAPQSFDFYYLNLMFNGHQDAQPASGKIS